MMNVKEDDGLIMLRCQYFLGLKKDDEDDADEEQEKKMMIDELKDNLFFVFLLY